MRSETDIAIIGAGPYGLSVAAHLLARGVDLRIFGRPMHTWLHAMPQGMLLKSEGFASTLYDPDGRFTLKAYCEEHGIPYADIGLPVRIDTFTSYGKAFQQQYVPNLEEEDVVSLAPSARGFDLRLESGEVVSARRVVVATGISHFSYIPPELDRLPGEVLTHSSQHPRPADLAGREVAIIGAGASAVDMAALLHEQGASVTLVARKPVVRFNPPPVAERPLLDRLRAPTTGLGNDWKCLLCTRAPLLFHRMPENFRVDVVRRFLGPAPGWAIRDKVEGRVTMLLGAKLGDMRVENRRVHLAVRHGDADRQIAADHVIAATGYRVDLDRLRFLDEGLRSRLRRVDKAPALSMNFESSVPGLYFVGVAAANSFGPMLRFAYGAGFTSRRLSRHLVRAASRGRQYAAATRH